ncbi:hypothetical protein DD237_000446 [Peronospora effusa]|uniref:Uncharacterized protein n=1 Tax=Peronospora effusa TaxID=542832 RepID=A0A425BVX8_9STRA|nr:hypothetical protein DD237_000446 [Peronospora effusa]
MEQEENIEEKKAAKEKRKLDKADEKQKAHLAATSARFVWTDGATMELLNMIKETKDNHGN